MVARNSRIFHNGAFRMTPPNSILTVAEAADYLKLHAETLRRMARRGQLPSFKIGTEWRFSRDALNRWIENQQRPSIPAPVVLVVDDEEVIRSICRRALEPKGDVVREANNGGEALRLLEEELPDVVLLDLKMPVMNGAAVLAEMKRRCPDVNVAIITAYADSDMMTRALKWSPFMVIEKPFRPKAILRCVQAIAPIERGQRRESEDELVP